MSKECCENCRFKKTDPDGIDRCHRFPPQVYTVPVDYNSMTIHGCLYICPQVGIDEWCGEYKRKK